MNLYDHFLGCIYGGAIGDALGSGFENQQSPLEDSSVFIWGSIKDSPKEWQLTDDTQFTLATCESIVEAGGVDPKHLAQKFLDWFQKGRLSGLGSASLQALQGLRAGGHWALVGKKGEQAAGNGAAMRIAPLAFVAPAVSKTSIRDVCRITHHNDEAYVGALAVVLALRMVMENGIFRNDSLGKIAKQLPDTNVRDRLIVFSSLIGEKTITEIAQIYGSSGYVVESVPLALFAVTQLEKLGFETCMNELIQVGGDTDTNASIFGQIAGAMLGLEALPTAWVKKLSQLDEWQQMQPIIGGWKALD